MKTYSLTSLSSVLLLSLVLSFQITGVTSVTTSITGSLSGTSLNFAQYGTSLPYKYFMAFRLSPNLDGAYVITSNSSIDTYGYLYNNTFNPQNMMTNLIDQDDDSAGNLQFRIVETLRTRQTYILVVTTANQVVMGNFQVSIDGPATVAYSLFIPTLPSSTTTATSTTGVPRGFSFSGSLTTASALFARPQASGTFYSQAYQINVPVSGDYIFSSVSNLDTYGYLYYGSYYPNQPLTNLIDSNDDGAGSGQFRMSDNLVTGRTYILIVTTYQSGMTGAFTVRTLGPAIPNVVSYWPPSALTTTAASSVTATGPVTQYNGYLRSSSTFIRPNGAYSTSYSYNAIRIQVFQTALYTLRSESSLDTYGCLYDGDFDPSYPSRNLYICDDDSGTDRQFLITRTLQSGTSYILVVTTYATNVYGSYTAKIIGSNQISVSSYIPVTARPIMTTTSSWDYDFGYTTLSTAAIIGIVIGSIVFFIVIISIISAAAAGSRQRRTTAQVVGVRPVNVRRLNQAGAQPQIAYISSSRMNATIHSVTEEKPPEYSSLNFNNQNV